jgi:hypothetical protein
MEGICLLVFELYTTERKCTTRGWYHTNRFDNVRTLGENVLYALHSTSVERAYLASYFVEVERVGGGGVGVQLQRQPSWPRLV